jgi:hypothetical protein
MLIIGHDFMVNPDVIDSIDLKAAEPVQATTTAGPAETTYCAMVVVHYSGQEHDLRFENSTAEEANQAAHEEFDKIHREWLALGAAHRFRR